MTNQAANRAVLDSPQAECDVDRTTEAPLSRRELHWLREIEKVMGQCPPPEIAQSLIGKGYAAQSLGRLGLTFMGKLYLMRSGR